MYYSVFFYISQNRPFSLACCTVAAATATALEPKRDIYFLKKISRTNLLSKVQSQTQYIDVARYGIMFR